MRRLLCILGPLPLVLVLTDWASTRRDFIGRAPERPGQIFASLCIRRAWLISLPMVGECDPNCSQNTGGRTRRTSRAMPMVGRAPAIGSDSNRISVPPR